MVSPLAFNYVIDPNPYARAVRLFHHWLSTTWGRDPRKGQGEIPGAEQSAPDLAVIPGGGHAKQVPNRAPTYTIVQLSSST
eukprot:4012054-Prymnesium_polylepis.1